MQVQARGEANQKMSSEMDDPFVMKSRNAQNPKKKLLLIVL